MLPSADVTAQRKSVPCGGAWHGYRRIRNDFVRDTESAEVRMCLSRWPMTGNDAFGLAPSRLVRRRERESTDRVD